jgi:hypothetical protein
VTAVWILWHGGARYSPGYVDDDAEPFPSLAAARDEIQARYFNRDGRTPCVEGDSAHVWFRDPRGERDPYPDLVMERGPRGGLQTSRA